MVRSNLAIKFLTEVLQDMMAVTDRLQYSDLRFKRGLVDVFLPYNELHRNQQHSAKQLLITHVFFHSKSSIS